jgi:hypothetical protein
MRHGEAHSLLDRAEHMARLLRLATDGKLTLVPSTTQAVKDGAEHFTEAHAFIDNTTEDA